MAYVHENLQTCANPPGEAEPGKSLEASVRDVACYGAMLGLGETYLSAYAIYLGASETMLGLLAAAPPFLGALLQVYSAHLLDLKPKRRFFYLAGATVQMLMWPVILSTIWMPHQTALPLLLAAVILYFSGVHFSSPAWNSTMGDLVPPAIRGRYFAWRNRTCIFCQWLGTVIAGTGLSVFSSGTGTHYGFALIFLGAFIARFISVIYLSKMTDPRYSPRPEDRFTLREFVRELTQSNFGWFVLYVSFFFFSINIIGPYFSLYMLRDLHFSYAQLTVAQAAIVAAQVIQLFTWGPLCDRFGNKRVLAVCGIGISFGPILWLVGRHPAYIFLLQFLAGTWWSGFNLSAANFIFDLASPGKRARCMAYFNLFNGTALFLGALTGAWLVRIVPSTVFGIVIFSPLYGLMVLSFVFRLASQILFLRRFREVRDVIPISTVGLFFRATYVKSITDLAMDLFSSHLREDSKENGEKSPGNGK